MDIYGNKVKLEVSWFFESPVMMQEDRIGSISDVSASIPLDDYYQDYGMDDYGNEGAYYPGGPHGGGHVLPPPFGRP